MVHKMNKAQMNIQASKKERTNPRYLIKGRSLNDLRNMNRKKREFKLAIYQQ